MASLMVSAIRLEVKYRIKGMGSRLPTTLTDVRWHYRLVRRRLAARALEVRMRGQLISCIE